MADSHYHLVTRWSIDGTAEEVGPILGDTEALVRWYPATYLAAEVLAPGAPVSEIGKVARVVVKGWMPHTLTFTFRITHSALPLEFTMETWGDFEGVLACTTQQDGANLIMVFDWKVRVTKPFVRHLTWLLRPFFVSNHLWVVARGEESLNIEVARRRAAAEGRPFATLPPGPTFPHGPLGAYITSKVWSRARLVDHSPMAARAGS